MPIDVPCPHCKVTRPLPARMEVEIALLLQVESAVIVMMCPLCGGIFRFHNNGSHILSPDEWLDLPAEARSEIQDTSKRFKEYKARLN